jgi:mannitol PTS system EIICBA or EIICB component
MGTSVIGAALLRKKVKSNGLRVTVHFSSLDEIPNNTDLIVSHKRMTERCREHCPNIDHFSLESYTDEKGYGQLMELLRGKSENDQLISKEQIMLSCRAESTEEAIRFVGHRMMELGFIELGYIDEMLQREKMYPTYIANGVAVPHGLKSRSSFVKKDGLVIAQFPHGVDFGQEKAYLLIGIAGSGKIQVRLLSAIAEIIADQELIEQWRWESSSETFVSILQHLHDRVEL